MRIEIQARGFTLSEALHAQVERSVRFALGSLSGRVRNVVVRLQDVNGPRGGIDKRCLMRAYVTGSAPVVIAHDEADLYVAIDRAADRMGRAVSRRAEQASRSRRAAFAFIRGIELDPASR